MLDMTASQIEQAQDEFVEMMPDIASIAACAFSDRDPESRDEAVAESVAMCWKNHLHCVAAEKDPGAGSMAYYAVQGVRSGRLMAGSSATDVLSPQTQIMGRAKVQSLDATPAPSISAEGGGAWWSCTEALVDKKLWETPPERVRVTLDYTKFLSLPEVTDQERTTFDMLARGYGTGEIAERLEVSAPRICQIKNSVGEKLVGFFGAGVGPACRTEGG